MPSTTTEFWPTLAAISSWIAVSILALIGKQKLKELDNLGERTQLLEQMAGQNTISHENANKTLDKIEVNLERGQVLFKEIAVNMAVINTTLNQLVKKENSR